MDPGQPNECTWEEVDPNNGELRHRGAGPWSLPRMKIEPHCNLRHLYRPCKAPHLSVSTLSHDSQPRLASQPRRSASPLKTCLSALPLSPRLSTLLLSPPPSSPPASQLDQASASASASASDLVLVLRGLSHGSDLGLVLQPQPRPQPEAQIQCLSFPASGTAQT